MKKPTGRPRGRPRRPPSEYADALVRKDPETEKPTEATGKPGKRIGTTLRLEPADWLRLRSLAARLSVQHGRPISAHELVHAAVMRMLVERAEGLDLTPERLVEAEGRAPASAIGDGVAGDD